MSLWASSYSFQLETFAASCSLFKVVLFAGLFYDDCKEPARCFPGLLVSIEYIDAMLGRVLARTPNRGPNCSMKLLSAQEQ